MLLILTIPLETFEYIYYALRNRQVNVYFLSILAITRYFTKLNIQSRGYIVYLT